MSSFQIQQFTRIHDDPCYQDVQNRDRQGTGAYQLTNLYPASQDAVALAYQQPMVPASVGGFGWSAAQINADSLLRNHSVQTNSPHCPIRSRTQARPFATVPYMGRGRGDAQMESQLQQPQWVRTDKSCGTISDAFYENQFTPMLDHVAQNVQNPVHLIPEVASVGWVRSGIPSRIWVRDQNC